MVPQDEPVLPSIAFLWPNAEWSEREATRAYGVRFRKDADVSRAAGIPKEKTG
jgi:NADH:ubiquinone oxidoreductase subunit C